MVKWAKVSSTVIEKSAEGGPVQSNEPKTICIITTYPHFDHIYSEMGKENRLAFRNYIIYLQTKKKDEWDEDEWDENETLHLIMMMVKKPIHLKTLQKIIYIKKINK